MSKRTVSVRRRLSILMLAVWLSGLLVACASQKPAPKPEATQPAKVLNVYNWDTYIDPTILTDFEQANGVTINYTTYGGSDEALSAIRANPGNYDVVVISDYVIATMWKDGLLVPLNKDNIPNFKNVDPAFVSPAFDPGNRYCVPYQWGTTGIGYNIKAAGQEIHGWKDLFEQAPAGRVSMLDDARVSLGATLIYLGYSPNSTNATEIAAARDFLLSHVNQISTYAPDTGQDLLAAGQVDFAFEYSGDIFQVMQDNPDLHYVIPEEGALIWSDNMCIPAQSPRQALAEQFINTILEPKVGAALSNFTRYATPNLAALPLINETDRNDPALYPSDQVRKRLFFQTDVTAEAAQLYEQAWAEIMAKYKQ